MMILGENTLSAKLKREFFFLLLLLLLFLENKYTHLHAKTKPRLIMVPRCWVLFLAFVAYIDLLTLLCG
eukprot:m.865 g.865  ORF g.865 m.865 type:complete len:69 (+) comp447_c0_seq1:196-402(+)